MKKQNLLLVLLLGIFVIFQSCEKKSLIDIDGGISNEKIVNSETEIIPDEIVYDFYYNNILINENPVELRNNKDSKIKNIIIVFEKFEKGQNKRVSINSFDNDEDYINWGIKNNIPVAEMLKKEKLIKEFIDNNNIEEIYEKTGKLPEIYIDFMAKLFGNNEKILAAPITIYKGLYSSEGAWLVQNSIPSLKHTTWNNQISGYTEHAVYGAVTWYNNSWYRYKMATTWNWGWNRIRFNGALSGLNDRTTSLINW